MREKKDFGKKPVRRSSSDEKEPAKVYRPRTVKLSSWEPRERQEEKAFKDDSPSERRSLRSSKSEDNKGSYSKTRRQENTGTRNNRDKVFSKRDAKSTPILRKKQSERKGESADRGTRSKVYERDSSKKTYGEKSKERKFSDRKTYPRDTDSRGEKTREFREKPYGKDSRRSEGKFTSEKKYGRSEKFKKDYSSSKFGFDAERKGETKKLYRRPPQIDSELKTDKDGLIRLNKYIANSGLCSRREADEYIEKGYITVNGVAVKELGIKVKITDEIRFKGNELDPERKVYILLNKPKDYITTVDDPNAKRTVMELIEGACSQRVYPVGRLDRNSTGLLLLTNDGELTKRLTHPSFMKKKVYEVGLERSVKMEDMEAILNGIEIDGEMAKADAVEYIDPKDKSSIGIEIHSGQNRIIRKIFEKLGYRVQKLDRVYFAGLTKKNLPRGKWRFLNQKEVEMLQMNRFN